MYCPETIILSRGPFWICRYDSTDWHTPVPWPERLNLLRYEFMLRIGRYPNQRRLYVNRKGKAATWLSNLTWRLWREKRWEKKRGLR